MAPEFHGLAVVVPTRNRAALAERSIRSIISGVGLEDVSILVSDNSTDRAEILRLRQFCQEQTRVHPETHIRYARPEIDLPMSEHWEWARVRAEQHFDATHFIYLTDRTVLKPKALTELIQIARRFPRHVISFNYDVVDDSARPINVVQEEWSGAVVAAPSRQLARLAAQLILPRPLPRMLNVVAPRRTFALMAHQYGSVFSSAAPDFCFCFRCLALHEEIIYVDRALTAMYALDRSNGASTARGTPSRDAEDFLRTQETSNKSGHATSSPKVTTNYSVIAAEYVAARDQSSPGTLPALNHKAYLRAITRETEVLSPGAMKDRNVASLSSAGISFGRTSSFRRTIANAWHYLVVMRPRDFAIQAAHRLSSARPAKFDDLETALTWVVTHAPKRRRRLSHLRYLGSVNLVPTETAAARQP